MIDINKIIKEEVGKIFNSFHATFVDKLKKLFPGGLKLYHRTDKANIPLIMSQGLLVSMGRDLEVIHTVLGDTNVDRIGGTESVTLEILVKPNEYDKLFPEEATYWTGDMNDIDGDERDDLMFRNYMQAHPDLIGGDITLYNDVSPERIKIVT